MFELIRDTVFGHLVRFVTRGKALPYPEDKNPDCWRQYVDHEKTARVAHHGHTEEPEDEDESKEEPSQGREISLIHNNQETAGQIASDQPEDFGTRGQHRPSQVTSSSEDTQIDHGQRTNDLGHIIDPEKGKDMNIIHFDGDSDVENPRNWSLSKKIVVTALICLLTTSIYIGSSIYTPGLKEITEIFGVSQVAATLGLTLFVAGYGIG